MKIKNRFLKRQKKPTDMALQITSMADIFTIILVFLLKSFSTGISNLTPNEIVLPEGTNGDEVTEMLKIEIGPKSILVDDKAVTKLEQFEINQMILKRWYPTVPYTLWWQNKEKG